MTVIAAGRYGNKSVIASDSLVADSERKVKNIRNFSKLIKFPEFIVGFAGDCSIFPVLYELSTDESMTKKKFMKMRNQQDALTFTKMVYSRLTDNLECNPLFGKEKDDEEIAEMLIASKYGIFEAESSPFACEIADFTAIGVGGDLAIGALNVLFQECIRDEQSLVQAVEKAVIIACENNTGCSRPVVIMEL